MEKKQEETTVIPLAAVPHLYREQILRWQKAHFEALKAIHQVLTEIRELLDKKPKRKAK